MNPYKTKLTPSYEINWGHSDEESPFIERKQTPVEIFDFKKYVQDQKQSKFLESVNNGGMGLNGPGFGGGKPIGNIFEGLNKPSSNNNSFGGNSNPFDFSNLLSQSPNNSKNDLDKTDFLDLPMIQKSANEQNINSKPEFDVDNILKKIDAKIAELEKEEQEEQKKQNNQANKITDYDKLDSTMVEKFDDFFKQSDNSKNNVKDEPKIVVDKDSKIVNDPSDDEYFDDFFSE